MKSEVSALSPQELSRRILVKGKVRLQAESDTKNALLHAATSRRGLLARANNGSRRFLARGSSAQQELSSRCDLSPARTEMDNLCRPAWDESLAAVDQVVTAYTKRAPRARPKKILPTTCTRVLLGPPDGP
eukprot:7032350-Prymnesium_polylepis.1